MSDLEVEAAGSGLVHIIASSEPAAGLLRMFCSPDDPPTAGRDGRQFILLARGNLDDVVERAHLAGLTSKSGSQRQRPTQPTQPTGSTQSNCNNRPRRGNRRGCPTTR